MVENIQFEKAIFKREKVKGVQKQNGSNLNATLVCQIKIA